MTWDVVYKSAINPDGSLLFPERLDKDFLESARKVMGTLRFSNQYLNTVLPDEERRFKLEWLRTYKTIPSDTYEFAFIDPAIGQNKHSDYTGIVVISVDYSGHWYLRVAHRYRLTPTQIVEKMFEICRQFKIKCLGVETVAYQEALLYMLDIEMKNRGMVLPVTGITRNRISKETRILALVPRFEWGRIFLSQGMTDFEDEYSTFPRGNHDDILDALASLEEIVYKPIPPKEKKIEKPPNHHHPDYERYFIQQRTRSLSNGDESGEDY